MTLRIGVLGAANIARSFIAGVTPSRLLEVACVASRDAARAEAFARETGVKRSHGSYEALLADPGVDAVYNPLPNSLHAHWSIRAAEAGKHVLCEKPLALGAAEARAMFDAARAHGVHLVEAYPYLAQPQTVTARRLLREGAIGAVQFIQASFGFSLPAGPNIRRDPALGGGALLDAGSYPVSLVRVLAGERPRRACAVVRWLEEGTVDRTMVAMLDFPGGAVAQIACSMGVGNHRQATIAGDDGVLQTTFLNHAPRNGPAVLTLKRGAVGTAQFETLTVEEGDGFRLEAESFARLVAGEPGGWTGATEEESLDIAAAIDAIRTSAQSGGAWVDLVG